MRTVQVELAAVHDMVVSQIGSYNSQFDEAMDSSVTKAVAAIREGQNDALSNLSVELERFYHNLRAQGSQLAVAMNEEIQLQHEKVSRIGCRF
jgi:hypothetical protein